MEACLAGGSAVSQWYLTLEGECIVGGMGVIDNDFHNRRDLTPNVCAVYTEADRRGRGIAEHCCSWCVTICGSGASAHCTC